MWIKGEGSEWVNSYHLEEIAVVCGIDECTKEVRGYFSRYDDSHLLCFGTADECEEYANDLIEELNEMC